MLTESAPPLVLFRIVTVSEHVSLSQKLWIQPISTPVWWR